MAEVTKRTVGSAATLLRKIVEKADGGDGVLTESELNSRWRQGGPDDATRNAVLSAIRKVKARSDRSIEGIAAGILEARDEVLAAFEPRVTVLGDAARKRVKTVLGKALVAFTEAHAGKKLADFDLGSSDGAVWKPSRPFRAPAGATADAFIDAALRHFNAFSNDNRQKYPNAVTRWVFGVVETRGLLAEIDKLTDARARAALRALSKRILQPDYRADGWEPKRAWLDAKAAALVEKRATALGVKASFRGDPTAPRYDYY